MWATLFPLAGYSFPDGTFLAQPNPAYSLKIGDPSALLWSDTLPPETQFRRDYTGQELN
jgi:hypothetical protein